MINKKNNLRMTLLIAFSILFIQISSSAKTPSDLSKGSIIPKPVSITATGGYFTLKSGTDIYIHGESEELRQIGQYLADRLKISTGFDIEVKSTYKAPRSGIFILHCKCQIKSW